MDTCTYSPMMILENVLLSERSQSEKPVEYAILFL